jgi:small subunit ribosomal protein S20
MIESVHGEMCRRIGSPQDESTPRQFPEAAIQSAIAKYIVNREEVLANTTSAKKRIRQNEKRRLRNRIFRTRARTYVKTARNVIEEGDLAAAEEAVVKAVRELDIAASKGVIHRNNAARRKSRLMRHLSKLKDK